MEALGGGINDSSLEVNVKFERAEQERPKCPFCEMELDRVLLQRKGIGFILPQNAVYFCPYCKKVLGVGQSRMA